MRAWFPTYIIQFFKLDIYDLVVLKDILKIVSANQNHEIYIYEFPSSLSYLKYISSVISLRQRIVERIWKVQFTDLDHWTEIIWLTFSSSSELIEITGSICSDLIRIWLTFHPKLNWTDLDPFKCDLTILCGFSMFQITLLWNLFDNNAKKYEKNICQYPKTRFWECCYATIL